MPIQGLTDTATIQKRALPLPVLASVKKGAEKPERGAGKNLDHFRFVWTDKRAEEMFNRLYGEDKQHELFITVLGDDVDACLDSSYRLYGSNNVMQRKCDGCTVLASLRGEKGQNCVCDPVKRDSDDANERRGQCSPKAYFYFTIPELCKHLGYLGQFVLSTGSVYEMRDIATVLYTVKQSSGKLIGQPFLLRRSEQHYDVILNGKPSKLTQWNVELVPPLQLVLANMDNPILAAPDMDALPSGLEDEPEYDWACMRCGNLATTEQAYTLLLECPDCFQSFAYRGDGEAPKLGDKLPEVKRFTPPAKDINNIDDWVDAPAWMNNEELPVGTDEPDSAEGHALMQEETSLRQTSSWPSPEQRFMLDLIDIIDPICNHENHARNAIKAAIADGAVTEGTSLDKAAAEIFLRRCNSQWGLSPIEVPVYVEKALGRGLRAYFADNPRDYRGVWQALHAHFAEFPL